MTHAELDVVATGRYSCPKLLVRDALKGARAMRKGGILTGADFALSFVEEASASEGVREAASDQLNRMILVGREIQSSRRVHTAPHVVPNPHKAFLTFMQHLKTVKEPPVTGRWDLVVSIVPSHEDLSGLSTRYDFEKRFKVIHVPSTVQIDPEGNLFWYAAGNFHTMWYAPNYGQWFTSEFYNFHRNKKGQLVVPTDLLTGTAHHGQDERKEIYAWKITAKGLVSRFSSDG